MSDKVDSSIFKSPKFMLLVRQGLIDRSKLGIYKLVVRKIESGKMPTSFELLMLNDLVVKLAAFTTSDNMVYQKARKMTKAAPSESIMKSSNNKDTVAELASNLLGRQDESLTDKFVRGVDRLVKTDRYKSAAKMVKSGKATVGKASNIHHLKDPKHVQKLAMEAYLDDQEMFFSEEELDEAGYMDPPKNKEDFEKRFPSLKYEEFLEFVEAAEEMAEACWKNYKQVGMKDKGGRKVPNCVPEEDEMDEQKNYHPGYNKNDPKTHHLYLSHPPSKPPTVSPAEKERRAKVAAQIKKLQAAKDKQDGGKAAWLAKHSKNNESVEVAEGEMDEEIVVSPAEKARRARVDAEIKRLQAIHAKKDGGKAAWLAKNSKNNESVDEAEIEERTKDRYNDVERVKIRKRQKEKRINRKPSLGARAADDPSVKAKRNKLAKIKNAAPKVDDRTQDDDQNESYVSERFIFEAVEAGYSLSDSMKDVLSDAFNLYFKAQTFHWNVEGERFNELHELFGNVYESTYESVDNFAEQLRTLDEKAPTSLKEILDRTIIEDEEVTNAVQMIAALEEMNADMIQSLYVTHKIAEKQNNLAITNYVEERIQTHEKFGWMLRSSMPETVTEQTEITKQRIAEHYAALISRTVLK